MNVYFSHSLIFSLICRCPTARPTEENILSHYRNRLYENPFFSIIIQVLISFSMARTYDNNGQHLPTLTQTVQLSQHRERAQQSLRSVYKQLQKIIKERLGKEGSVQAHAGSEPMVKERSASQVNCIGLLGESLKKRLKGEDSRRDLMTALADDPRFSKLMGLEAELKGLCKDQQIGLKKTTKHRSSVLRISLKNAKTLKPTKHKKKLEQPPVLIPSYKSKYYLHPHMQTHTTATKQSTSANLTQSSLRSQRGSLRYLESNRSKNFVKSKLSIPVEVTTWATVASEKKDVDFALETPQTAPTSIQPSIKEIHQEVLIPDSKLEEQPIIRITKTVKFQVSSESDIQSFESITGLTSTLQENIVTLLVEQRFEDVLDEIKKAEDHIDHLQDENPSHAISFALKLSKWCRQAGRERYATLLLKRVIPRHEDDAKHKLMLLKELSRNYEELKEYKNAIEVNLELIKLGETEYLDRLGQIHMMRENYSESLKCYQKYHEIKGNIYSLVKLAHACSKIPSYSKRAIQMLNEILFENKTSCIFKMHPPKQAQDFQSALLLLVTIYMNLNGHKKATEICEKYLKKNFGAYSIFYILGILKLKENHHEQAFSCFLSSIRLKPNHLPSLIELLKFLNTNSAEVLRVLRKAFLSHHRDWQLLQLLVQAATKTKSKHAELSVQGLIHCAKLLQGVSEEQQLSMQIQAVWLWAAEMIDQRQKRMSVVDQQFVENVYVRLGEISLRKGNYLASERYFSRVLQKLQIQGNRMRTLPKMHYLRLELQILRRLAYLKSQQKDLEAARKFLEQSRDSAIRFGLPMEAISDGEKVGKMLFMFERYEEAAKQFGKCCGIIEQLPDGLQQDKNWQKWKEGKLKIADCYQNMHKWKQARKVYQSILSHRICEEAIRNLANLYAWQGSPQLAKELLQSLKLLNLEKP